MLTIGIPQLYCGASGQQGAYNRQEIGLARAALERGDDTAYRAALTRVDAWLPRLWPDSPARRQVHARLRTLQQAQAPARPAEVGSTLQQLRALRSAGMRLRPTRETPEVTP